MMLAYTNPVQILLYIHATLSLILGSIIVICYSQSDEKIYCFDESERVTIYWNNDTTMPYKMPTVNIHIGAWESARAVTYIGSILLNEKMGVPIKFFPTDDPSDYWQFDLDYPNNFGKWIVDDRSVDIYFEFWDFMITSESFTQAFVHSTVFKFFSKVVGSEGIYLSTYTLSQFPSAGLYTGLDRTFAYYIFNQTKSFFETFIFTNHINYNDTYSDIDFSSFLDLSFFSNFFADFNGTLLVWITSEVYSAKTYTEGMLNAQNVPNVIKGLTGESTQLLFMKLLTKHDIDFVTYSFAPTVMHEALDLSRIHFPGNPSSTFTDPCFDTYSCDIPDQPLFTVWHSDILAQIVEVDMFMRKFALDRTKLHAILNTRIEKSETIYANLSSSEQWFKTVCDWIKENPTVWEPFIEPIIRTSENTSTSVNTVLVIIVTVVAAVIAVAVFVGASVLIYRGCKRFQASWGAELELSSAHRRGLMIDILTHLSCLIMGIFDMIWDWVSLISVVYLSDTEYPETFIYAYCGVIALGIAVSVPEIVLRTKIIIQQSDEIRNGIDLTSVQEIQTEYDKYFTYNRQNMPGQSKKLAEMRSQQAIQRLSVMLSTNIGVNDLLSNKNGRQAQLGSAKQFSPSSNESLKNKKKNSFKNLNVNNSVNDVALSSSSLNTTDKVTKMYNQTARIIIKKSKVERQIQSSAVSVFVVLFECIPVMILNVYSIAGLRIINLILILSTVSSAITVGYKGASVNQLFTSMSEKKTLDEDLKHQIADQVEFEQELSTQAANEIDLGSIHCHMSGSATDENTEEISKDLSHINERKNSQSNLQSNATIMELN